MFVNRGPRSVMIQGESGLIEGKHYVSDKDDLFGKSIALVLHPDSACGGTMNNKVVQVLFDVFQEAGFDVLKINFRGVGRSQGKYDNGVGEINDSLKAMDWLLDQHRNEKISNAWVAGFGFGSLMCMQTVMRRPAINGFIGVSPPKESMNLNMLTPCPNGMFVVGENDHTSNGEFIKQLSETLACQQGAEISCKSLKGADHYLTDDLETLRDASQEYVKENMLDACAPMHIKRKQRRSTSV